MARLNRFFVLPLALGLAGCSTATLPTVSVSPLAAVGPTEAPLAAAPAAEVSQAHGWINLRIRWPEQEPTGFEVAAIPTTTNALAVWVKLGGINLGQPTILTRQPNLSVATASIRVEAAEGLSVEVKAYREPAPDLALDEPLAVGNATNVTVVRSRVSPLAITMNARFVPTVEDFSVPAAQAGDTLILTGTNFGGTPVAVPTVSFNGVPATGVVRNSDTQLTVVVPGNALTGNVVVKADGIESTSTSPFYVVSLLEAQLPTKQSWDNSGPSAIMVPYGGSVTFGSRLEWALKSGETVDQYGTPPSVAWTTTDAAAGILAATGKFTASASYATTAIRARVGTLASQALNVTVVGVDSVALNTSTLTLNAKPESGLPDPGYTTNAVLTATVTTSGPVDDRVTWSSSDTSRVTVDAAGRVETVSGAPEGAVTITAASIFDPSKKATASVTVTILGGLDLGID